MKQTRKRKPRERHINTPQEIAAYEFAKKQWNDFTQRRIFNMAYREMFPHRTDNATDVAICKLWAAVKKTSDAAELTSAQRYRVTSIFTNQIKLKNEQ